MGRLLGFVGVAVAVVVVVVVVAAAVACDVRRKQPTCYLQHTLY